MVQSRLTRGFFARSAIDVAPDLLGVVLVVGGCSVVLTEVEAYVQNDPASHSFRGPTPRNAAMFGPPGRAYVYLCYGVHWCINVVTGPVGAGEAVLLRGGVVQRGEALIRERRPKATTARSLTDGPGKLTAALGIDRTFDRADFLGRGSAVRLVSTSRADPVRWSATTRIGISVAQERMWRFVATGPDELLGRHPLAEAAPHECSSSDTVNRNNP